MFVHKYYAYVSGWVSLAFIFILLSLPSLAMPGLSLTKNCSTMSAYLGDTIVYNFRLENNGTETLSDLVLVDDHIGVIPLNQSTLKAGESFAVSVPYQIDISDVPGVLINSARCSAKCEGKEVFSNNASFIVSLGVSGIENITKAKSARNISANVIS
jgi:uncharacterized repeat protein (TIGR01451 family)